MMKNDDDDDDEAMMKFPTTCPSCGASTDTDMCVMNLPHFKEVIIMSLTCEKCGYKSNEVKGGGEIASHGTRITLRAETTCDMSRGVVKSDTACVAIPEIDFELKESGLGLYTTVEGLLMKMHDGLKQASPFASKDSTNHDKFDKFLSELKNMAEGNRLPFTLIITDPISNSFVGPITESGQAFVQQADQSISDDKRISIEEFQRSREEDDRFGLSDMNTS
jgi:zinc finger protein|mmetsp:Transcript_32002/g.54593  ORF Transcript_32002/g.54593 Transcript_32002/m.54593 type:complete len:221 (+) Transcript_32002:98-760(+)